MKNTNLLETITHCLREHQVNLIDGKKKESFYLIEVSAPSSLLVDFKDTYGSIDPFKTQLADRTLSSRVFNNVYGVLVGQDMRYKFAFNRNFADLNKDKTALDFRSVEDILLNVSSGGTTIQSPKAQREETTYRYSLLGRKNKPAIVSSEQITFKQPSLLSRIASSYAKNAVPVKLNGKKSEIYYLITTKYKTSTFDDFKLTYPEDNGTFKLNLAKKVFGTTKQENTYQVLFTPQLEMVFAFNTLFANYDRRTESIVYSKPEDVLINNKVPNLVTNFPRPRPRPLGPGLGGMVMRYSLQGKN